MSSHVRTEVRGQSFPSALIPLDLTSPRASLVFINQLYLTITVRTEAVRFFIHYESKIFNFTSPIQLHVIAASKNSKAL